MNEMPKVINSIERVARKKHSRFGCGCDIDKGESYRYTSGIWDEPQALSVAELYAGLMSLYANLGTVKMLQAI